jgi:serine/threonine protein kinase/sugar lactone lactonase YvrE
MARTIAHYEILEKIGEGGMGEVYKARDTKLDRPVAMKILPPHLVEDSERLRRFVLEARAASALNHPSIVTIYEVGEARDAQSPSVMSSGVPSGESAQEEQNAAAQRNIHYIAMEFVSGQSLGVKIHRDKTELKRLLQYLVQVAEGLAKAHSAGIVHRDLKPDNIMVSEDGFAKILDFGLAKLVEAGENSASTQPSAHLEDAPTAVMDRTRPGLVMGTVGYMSPEQVQGKPIDQRSDIFAFGCILYEAAAARKPFQGDSIIDSLHKIIYSQPAPLAETNPSAPAELQRMIRKCIAKDPDDRYQSAKDIAIDLRALIADMDSGSFVQAATQAPTAGGSVTSPNVGQQTAVSPVYASDSGGKTSATDPSASLPPFKARINPKLLASAIAAALVTFGLLYLLIGLKHARSRLGSVFQDRKITRLTSSGKSLIARISPDGKYVAYVASDQGQQSIWLRQIATSSNVQVVAPADVDYKGLAFSPDGNYIYYSTQDKGKSGYSLSQVASLGGSPRKVLEQVIGSISFSPDAKSFAFVRNDSTHNKSMLWIAKSDGTGEQKMAEREIPNQFLQPAWSPDGKVIACSLWSFTGAVHTEITTLPAAGGPEMPIPTRPWAEINGLQWLSDGTGLLISAADPSAGPERSQIYRVSYPSGRVQQVTNDLNNYAGISITADSSSLITLEYTAVSNIWTVPFSPGGSARQITSGSGKYAEVTCVQDGRIVYCSDASGGSDQIWIMDPDGKNQKQLTSDAGMIMCPAVAQDMRHVVFTSGRVPGAYNTWRVDIDGSNPKQLTTGQGDYFPALSPDGKWLYYTVVTTNERPRIWRAPADGGSAAPLIDLFTFITQVSPDGKLLACGYNDTQDATALNLSLKLGVFPAEGGPPIKRIPMPTGTMGHAEPGQFRWARDGRSLIYLQNVAGVSNLWSQALAGGSPKQVTNFSSDQIFDFDITADGKQFVCSRGNISTDVILIKDTGNP